VTYTSLETPQSESCVPRKSSSILRELHTLSSSFSQNVHGDSPRLFAISEPKLLPVLLHSTIRLPPHEGVRASATVMDSRQSSAGRVRICELLFEPLQDRDTFKNEPIRQCARHEAKRERGTMRRTVFWPDSSAEAGERGFNNKNQTGIETPKDSSRMKRWFNHPHCCRRLRSDMPASGWSSPVKCGLYAHLHTTRKYRPSSRNQILFSPMILES
jgi:hypothetical protein